MLDSDGLKAKSSATCQKTTLEVLNNTGGNWPHTTNSAMPTKWHTVSLNETKSATFLSQTSCCDQDTQK